jgi:hypothetical protein
MDGFESRKIALPLGRGGNDRGDDAPGTGRGIGVQLPHALPAAPEEKAIAFDGSTDIGSKLVLDILAAMRVEEVPRIQIGVAEVFVRGTVKLVGAALGGDVDDGVGIAPVFGAIQAGHHAKFTEKIGAGDRR